MTNVKAGSITLVIMTIVSAVFMFCIICSNKRELDSKDAQIQSLKAELKKEQSIPQWYKKAYYKCTSFGVPRKFFSECVEYEVSLYE